MIPHRSVIKLKKIRGIGLFYLSKRLENKIGLMPYTKQNPLSYFFVVVKQSAL